MLRYKKIKNLLLEQITKLKSGERLPSRPELCVTLTTNRTTLDKAINELVTEGILSSKTGSGTYVVGLWGKTAIQTKSWGVIVPNVMEEIYPGLVRGAENAALHFGVNIILCNSDNDAEKQEQYIKRLIFSGVSGFIIVPVITNDIRENFRLYSQLKEAKIPFVFCNRSIEGISVPVVTSNDFYGGYIATKHLIEKGYRHIAYISRIKYKTSTERCQGYLSALIENGMGVNRELLVIEMKNETSPDGYSEMKKILHSGIKVDAVFCFNDQIARGVCQAIKAEGLRVSRDIGIIGYDNSHLCEVFEPKITSVAYMNVEIGEKAAELLWEMVNRQPLSNFEFYLFQPSIIVRESCLGPEDTVARANSG